MLLSCKFCNIIVAEFISHFIKISIFIKNNLIFVRFTCIINSTLFRYFLKMESLALHDFWKIYGLLLMNNKGGIFLLRLIVLPFAFLFPIFLFAFVIKFKDKVEGFGKGIPQKYFHFSASTKFFLYALFFVSFHFSHSEDTRFSISVWNETNYWLPLFRFFTIQLFIRFWQKCGIIFMLGSSRSEFYSVS